MMHLRNSYIWLTAVAGLSLLGACGASDSGSGTGTLAVQLTDAPFPSDSVKSVDVWVLRVDARQADADSAAADSASGGGWTTVASPNASVNLLAYQNGNALPLGSGTLTAGNYLGFRLVIDPSKSSLTLQNGQVLTATSTPSVSFPSGSTTGIKIVLTKPVTVAAHAPTPMLVDFQVNNSFVMRGSSISQNGLLFKPVVIGSTK